MCWININNQLSRRCWISIHDNLHAYCLVTQANSWASVWLYGWDWLNDGEPQQAVVGAHDDPI